MSWWADAVADQLTYTNISYDVMHRGLQNYALKNRQTVTQHYHAGRLRGQSRHGQDIHDFLLGLGFTVFVDSTWNHSKQIDKQYIHKSAVAKLWVDTNSSITVSAASTDRELLDAITGFTNPRIGPAESEGCVFVLTVEGGAPRLKSMGFAAEHLERGNYSQGVIDSLDHVVADLKKKNPCGRISIFDGEAGTGKTFLVRALLDLVPNAMMVVLPPNLVSQLSGPSLISVMMEHVRSNNATVPEGDVPVSDGDLAKLAQDIVDGCVDGSKPKPDNTRPIVFILEDADEVLVPRGVDNMSDISALLNLTDGILGRMLDVRIVATTNAANSEFEKAIMRPGRLCRQISVDRLSPRESLDVMMRLTGKSKVELLACGYEERMAYTLAELYHFAAQGHAAEQREKPRMGFGG